MSYSEYRLAATSETREKSCIGKVSAKSKTTTLRSRGN